MLTNTVMHRRLNVQQQRLMKDPIQGVLVKREGQRNFHFVIYNLDHPYKDGYYHGLLELHQNYPFAAPKLFFYTPSGRFIINTAICTSFTNYHQQSWSSGWNVRTLLLATVSFMTSDQPSYGCCKQSDQVRIKLAKNSLEYNKKNDKFCQLFQEQFKRINVELDNTYIKTETTNNMQEVGNISKQEEIIQQAIQNKEVLLNQNQNIRPNQQVYRQRKKICVIAAILIFVIILIIIMLL